MTVTILWTNNSTGLQIRGNTPKRKDSVNFGKCVSESFYIRVFFSSYECYRAPLTLKKALLTITNIKFHGWRALLLDHGRLTKKK